VILHSCEQRADISFHLIDSRNSARIRYERINEETGEEVPWDKIVKGYQYEDNNYVLLNEDELEHASIELTRSIDIEQFVELSQIDVRYFDRPYVLVPDTKGEKGYVLLREAIAKTGKAGIAKVVIRARQHLAALMVHENALILELLRFDQELRSLRDFDLPTKDLRTYKVNGTEVALATKLIDGMTTRWRATEFQDEYRAALMKLVERKVKQGETQAIEGDDHEEGPPARTINFMDMLKRSVSQNSKSTRSKRPAKRPGRHTPKKKRAS
jgi:DNA end-binding protein Ku